MRKFALSILALVGLLCPADAAYFQAQTYLPSRTQVSITASPYNGVCDAQAATRVVTTSGTGNKNIAVTVNTFTSGDVGKTLAIPGAGDQGNYYTGIITSFIDAQNVVVGSNLSSGLSSTSVELIWGTDNLTALTTFKTAFQAAPPVQLNLPGNCGYTVSGGGIGKFPFEGIPDLIVAGNGAATSGIYAFNGDPRLGGQGQYQDNLHSVRTTDANAGDSCVTLKTQPAVTISNVAPTIPYSASFTASASGNILTVTAVASGTIAAGVPFNNVNATAGGFGRLIQPYGTSGTTGTGGVGTYAFSGTALSYTSQFTYTSQAYFTASVDATGKMTVTSIGDGALAVGMPLLSASGGINTTTTIKSQLTGSAGGVGDYQLDNSPTNAIVSPVAFVGVSTVLVTLNSTTGLSTGDTIFFTGVTGTAKLPSLVNGLKWIKVVNSTQVELFQWTFDGAYISGGTGGGDRTSLFPNGSKVLMTGWINQAYWSSPYGYPSNPNWFEYRTVVSTNSTTHQVCFDAPLTNSYKSTWPQYNTGSQFEVDPGGPATLYVLNPTWETSIEYKDLALYTPSGQTTANGRTITFRNVTMAGVHCAIPTQNVTHNWINVNGPDCNIETDKIVGTWNITGTNTLRKVVVQSSSMDEINISGLTIDTWSGGGKRLNVNLSSFACSGCTTGNSGFSPGTVAYGVSDLTSITNSSVGFDFGGTLGGGTDVLDPKRPWSMTGGVITIPNAYSFNPGQEYSEIQTRYIVPGHYMFWFGKGGGGTNAQAGRAFKIVDVTQDIVNTYVQTSEAGGFPTGAWTTNGLKVNPHPSPVFTASGLSGADRALSLNGCTSLPLWSCQNFTYTGSATGGSATQYGPYIIGEISSFTFTNNVPYTNTGALGWTVTRFGNWQILQTNLTTTTFGTSNMINTKLPSSAGGGTRTLTLSGATGTQSLDNLTAPPAGALFGGQTTSNPIFTANTPSDSPQVTMTLRTNQNLPP